MNPLSRKISGLSRQVSGRELADVRLVPLDEHIDARGSFTEVFSTNWSTGIEPAQWNVVRSVEGVLRGMHFHRRHDEYLHVISGTMVVGLFDLRAGSPTIDQAATYQLDAADPALLVFSHGFVHGWLSVTASVHLQAVSESYSTYGIDDNEGCRWDDPELRIEWPVAPRLVSERAQRFPPLAVLRRSIDV